MNDYIHHANKSNDSFLDQVLEHIQIISLDKCDITDEHLLDMVDEKNLDILSGLQMLHEDLQLYKKEYAEKIEADYQVELLKKQNEELLQFNYVASHDLQEPLRTITSFSNLLKVKYSDQLNEEANTFIDFIQESSKRMSGLIFDLLNYSRIGSSYKFDRHSAKDIVGDVMQDLSSTITELNPIISIGKLPDIYCNRNTIYQVFQNLIGNAIKFSVPNQAIKIDISTSSDEDKHTFCLSDNGIGIDMEYKDRIFGVFQRLHTKDEYEGTGIGLALCEKVIKMHGGDIWFESEKGKGTKFYFTLPKKYYI